MFLHHETRPLALKHHDRRPIMMVTKASDCAAVTVVGDADLAFVAVVRSQWKQAISAHQLLHRLSCKTAIVAARYRLLLQ